MALIAVLALILPSGTSSNSLPESPEGPADIFVGRQQQTSGASPRTPTEFVALMESPSGWLGEDWASIGTSTIDAGEATTARSASMAGPSGQQLGITLFEMTGDPVLLGELLVAAIRAFDAQGDPQLEERPLPSGLAAAWPECRGGRFASGSRPEAAAVLLEARALCPLNRASAVLVTYRGLFASTDAGIASLSALLGQSPARALAPEPTAPAWTVPDDVLAAGRFLGRPDAPVALQVWGDYQSPGSRNFSAAVLPVLIEEFVATGEVLLEAQDYALLGDESILAATAAECASAQDRFWNLHLILHANRGDAPQSGAFSRPRLDRMAEMAALDRQDFARCMDAPEARRAVDASSADARRLGVHSVPALVVNGRQIPWRGWDELRFALRRAVDQDRAAAGSEPDQQGTISAVSAAQDFTVTSRDIYFDPSEFTIPADTAVKVNVPNEGAAPHNFSIDALKVSVDVAPRETRQAKFNAPAGVYEYYCNVPGHKQAGMVGMMTAR